MGKGKLGEAWRAPNASWGVAGADGSRAGCSEDFQGAARQADIPRLATGACQETIGFCLGEPGAGAPGPLVLTENKSMTGRREKDSGFCFRRALRGSARVLVLAGNWPGSAEDGLCPCAVWGCGALNLGRRFVELTLPQAKEYNPYRVEMAPTHTLPRREGLFCLFVSW